MDQNNNNNRTSSHAQNGPQQSTESGVQSRRMRAFSTEFASTASISSVASFADEFSEELSQAMISMEEKLADATLSLTETNPTTGLDEVISMNKEEVILDAFKGILQILLEEEKRYMEHMDRSPLVDDRDSFPIGSLVSRVLEDELFMTRVATWIQANPESGIARSRIHAREILACEVLLALVISRPYELDLDTYVSEAQLCRSVTNASTSEELRTLHTGLLAHAIALDRNLANYAIHAHPSDNIHMAVPVFLFQRMQQVLMPEWRVSQEFSTEFKFTIKCLAGFGEYQEVLEPVLTERIPETILELLQAPNILVQYEVLELISHLVVHKKFASLFVDIGGLEVMLEVASNCPHPSFLSGSLSWCFSGLATLTGIMEILLQVRHKAIRGMVRQCIRMLSSPQDFTRKNSLFFFTNALSFPLILSLFDRHGGLRILLDSVVKNADDEAGGSMGSNMLKHTMLAIRQYVCAHVAVAVHHLKALFGKRGTQVSNTGQSSTMDGSQQSNEVTSPGFRGSNPCSSTKSLHKRLPAHHWLPLDDKSHEDRMSLLQPRHRHKSPLVSHFIQKGIRPIRLLQSYRVPVEKEQGSDSSGDGQGVHRNRASAQEEEEDGIRLLLQVVFATTARDVQSISSNSQDAAVHALQVLRIVTLFPGLYEKVCAKPVHEDDPSLIGIRVLLEAAYGGLLENSNPKVTVGALEVLGNCCSRQLGDDLAQRHIRRLARHNNALMVLLELLNYCESPSEADRVQYLACLVLLGLARDKQIAQVLNSLQVVSTLSLKSRSSPIVVENKRTWRKLRKTALELIEAIQGSGLRRGDTKPALLKDVADATHSRLDKAMIVAQTQVSFRQTELLKLIQEHLLARGLVQTAALLSEESGIGSIGDDSQANSTPKFVWPSNSNGQLFSRYLARFHPLKKAKLATSEFVEQLHNPLKSPEVTTALETLDTTASPVMIEKHQSRDSMQPSLEEISSRSKTPLKYGMKLLNRRKSQENTRNTYLATPNHPIKSIPILGTMKTPTVDEKLKLKCVEKQHVSPRQRESECPVPNDSHQLKQPGILPVTKSPSAKRLAGAIEKDPLGGTPIKDKRLKTSDDTSPRQPRKSPGSRLMSSRKPLSWSQASARATLDSAPLLRLSSRNRSRRGKTALTEMAQETSRTKSKLPLAEVIHPKSALEQVVQNQLREQHRACPNPICVVPTFSLTQEHKCPESGPREAPVNLGARLARAQTGSQWGGRWGKVKTRRLIHSRWRRIRRFHSETPNAEPSSFSAASFLHQEGRPDRLLVGGGDGSMLLYNMDQATFSGKYPLHDSAVSSLTFRVGHVVSYAEEDAVAKWSSFAPDQGDLQVKHTFRDCAAIELSPDASAALITLATSSRGAQLHDLATGSVVQQYNEAVCNKYSWHRACFAPDGGKILHDGVLWDIRTNMAIHKFDKLSDCGLAVFHPSGNHVIINSTIWDLRTYKLLAINPTLNQSVAKFDSLGDVIYSYSPDLSDSFIVPDKAPSACQYVSVVDGDDFNDIAMHHVEAPVIDLCIDKGSRNVAVIVDVSEEDNTNCELRVMEIGRPKPLDYDSDVEDFASDSEEYSGSSSSAVSQTDTSDEDDLEESEEDVEIGDELSEFSNSTEGGSENGYY